MRELCRFFFACVVIGACAYVAGFIITHLVAPAVSFLGSGLGYLWNAVNGLLF